MLPSTRTDNLMALTDVIQAINSSLDLDDVLRIVMDTIIRLTRAERGFLMLRNQQGELITRVARDWEQETIDPNESALSRTVIHRVVSEGKPILTTNAQEDPRFGHQESIIIHNLRSILCVPLKVKDELTGVIYADNRIHSGVFTETERELLTTFANHAAVAIENARLFVSLRQTLAEVTGLKNLMDNVLSSIVSGVITADVQRRISLANRSARLILGQAETDLVGASLDDFLPLSVGPQVAAEVFREIEQVRQTDTHIIGKELNCTLPNRGAVALRLNVSPLKDADLGTQGVAIVIDDMTEKKRLEGQRRLFERMVSPAVIDQLDPDQVQLGGQHADITVLFIDIRGFTSFSERLSPEVLVNVLNQYLAAAADAILAQEGTIDKFLGDGVMAWFNAPILQPDHAMRAIRAALGVRAAVQRLHHLMPPAFHLSFGAGIHFGEAILGLVGTEKRLDYTAIGDSVNTAKRIQENSAANQILVSDTLFAQVCDQVIGNPIEPLHLKGKREPFPVYEIIGLK